MTVANAAPIAPVVHDGLVEDTFTCLRGSPPSDPVADDAARALT